MAWAIITMYTSKCAQMDPQQLLKTLQFYSRCKKCDIEKTVAGWVPPPPLGSPKVNHRQRGDFKASRPILQLLFLCLFFISPLHVFSASYSKSRNEEIR